jgi:hypothetical protein
MCFYKSDLESERRYKVSDKDIPCYKIVMSESGSDIGISEVVEFRYQVGRTYVENSVPLGKLDDPGFEILTGGVFHSYTRLSLGLVLPYHSSNRVKGYNFYYIMDCVIPAGTPYWENSNRGEFASTSIRILGLRDLESID